MQESQKMSENVRVNLSSNQEKAIMLLLSNQTISEVAKHLSVNERTLYRWLAIPLFQERLEQEKIKLRDEALSTLKVSFNKIAHTALSKLSITHINLN